MAAKIIVGLAALVAIVLAVAPDANTGGILSMALVALGVAYAVMNVNAEDATGFLVLVIASGAAAQADVLSVIPAVGAQLDAVVDGSGYRVVFRSRGRARRVGDQPAQGLTTSASEPARRTYRSVRRRAGAVLVGVRRLPGASHLPAL